MADYLPKHRPGDAITRTATANLTGGQLITAAGAVAGANAADWLGVAGYDVASGGLVTVYNAGVQRLTANGAVTVGALVKCAAVGKVAPWVSGTDGFERVVGIALDAATADGDVIAVKVIR